MKRMSVSFNKYMKLSKNIVGSVLALIIGSFYFYPFAWSWGYIAKYNPIIYYILDLARNGMPITFRVVVAIQDFFISLILMLPLALIIFRIRPAGSWLYIGLALIACKATELFPVWPELMSFFDRVSVFEYLLVSFSTYAPALIAYWILRKRHKFPTT